MFLHGIFVVKFKTFNVLIFVIIKVFFSMLIFYVMQFFSAKTKKQPNVTLATIAENLESTWSAIYRPSNNPLNEHIRTQ